MDIRENPEQHLQELRVWLAQTKDTPLEEMSAFFSARIDGYEEHMAVWEEAYRRFAELVPETCTELLDLGCGTGLELDEIFKRFPALHVTGVDLCTDMLDNLLKKHRDKNLHTVCADYFDYEMGENRWDVILSFESLHHFFPEKKLTLYQKIHRALQPGGVFLLGDYLACCEEEETLLRQVYLEKRAKASIPEERFVHFDIPLTLEHETGLMKAAGFRVIRPVDCINGAAMLLVGK